LSKTSTGTLVLNATTNAFTSLTIGGIPGGGGIVSTAMGTAAGQQPFGTGTVTQIISPSTIQLKSGEIVRLSGLNFPDYSEDNAGSFSLLAVKVLKDMLEGQQIVIYQTRNKAVGRMNRMGHSLAHLARSSDNAWVQGMLLQLGLALVQTDQGNPEMAAQMLKLEAQARGDKIGLWENPIHILRAAETPEHIGEFVIVEDQVESVALKNNRLYMNFGKNRKNDFTVSVAPESKRNFNKAGLNPLDWNKRTLRVRGVLDELNGPSLEIDHPGAIETINEETQESILPPKTPVDELRTNTDNALPLPMTVREENKPHPSQTLPSTREKPKLGKESRY
jgi:endonuclease YncB( thermonuclease family)